MESATQRHDQRPTAMPTGMPSSKATTDTVTACHETQPATWRGRKPMARSTAKSCRRRRTAVASTWPRAPSPRSTRKPASALGQGADVAEEADVERDRAGLDLGAGAEPLFESGDPLLDGNAGAEANEDGGLPDLVARRPDCVEASDGHPPALVEGEVGRLGQ